MDIKSKQYPVKVNGEFTLKDTPTVQHASAVMSGLSQPDARRGVEKAANAYKSASKILSDTMTVILDAAVAMAKVWGDKPSVEAQQALRALYVTVRDLSGKTYAVGTALEQIGETVMGNMPDNGKGFGGWDDGSSWDDSIGDITFDGGDFWESDRDRAKRNLQEINNQLQRIHSILPDEVREDLPDIGPSSVPPPPIRTPTIPTGGVKTPTFDTPSYDPNSGGLGTGNGGSSGTWPDSTFPGGTGSGGTGSGGVGPGGIGSGGTGSGDDKIKIPGIPPGPGGDGSQYPNIPPGGNGTTIPNIPTGPTSGMNTPDARTTNLADFQPPNVDTLPNNQSIDPRTGLPTGMGTGNGTGTGNGMGTGNGTSTGPNSGYGTGVATGMGSGGYGSATQAGARGASTQGMGGMPMMPPMGAGAPGGQEERRKEDGTWLMEEDDVWGTNDHNAIDGPTVGI
ncbi:hypothetical protein [Nonomuraea dietziae]|uniref:hypothetical protein n=1 Tax=Nonomuraea dietziae TaxID=65515 RepID=UPI0033D479C7